MAESNSANRSSLTSLILVPSLITLLITILRVYGELHQWPKPWFSSQPGGGAAIIGISWLPLIFGPYFALKLSGAGAGPRSTGKSIGFGALGFVLIFGGGFLAFSPHFSAIRFIGGLLLMVLAAAIQFNPWPELAKTLLAYAYAARIPVAIVMFFAMRGNWGTHYDVVPPNYTGPTSLVGKWFAIGAIPQLILWIAFTMTVGMLFGGVVTALVRRGRTTTEVAAR
jgi:hypothetical protein